MAGVVYFGTKQQMAWIPAPKISMPRGVSTWDSGKKFLSGGASVRRSGTGARTYDLDWALAKGTDLNPIYAYADRAYGDGPFYFVDPDAANYNLFPQYQAHPYLGVVDAPVLYGTSADSFCGLHRRG
jgi:hypothetical protein